MAVSVDDDSKNKKLTLFVRNLPDTATKEQLDLLFSEVGKIRHCFVVKKGQNFKGIGYVTLTNEEDVTSALGRSFKLGSNQLNVTLADDKKKQDPFAAQKKIVKVNFSKEAKDARKLQKSRVIVRNLSFKATEEDLRKTFEKFGEIRSINIPKKPDGKMRGFGFIQFESTPHAIKAVKEMNMKPIKGRPVAVDFTVAKQKFEEVRKQKRNEPERKETEDSPSKSSRSRQAAPETETGEEEDDDEDDDSSEADSSEEEENPEEEPPPKGERKRKRQSEAKAKSKKESDESSDGDSSDEDDASDDDQFEKKHLQKRLKKPNGNQKTDLRGDQGENSDSEVEFGSDGEVRLVQRDQVKDKKKILKKKPVLPKGKKPKEESGSEESEDEEEEAMEVDGSDKDSGSEAENDESGEEHSSSDDDDDSEKSGKKTKSKKKNKKTEDDSDSDWGHTPSEGSSDEENTKDDEEDEKAKRRAEMIEKEDLNRTVFLSNISFDTTQKTLQEHIKKFGPYKFCLLCMDKVLNRSKGTAFVKFEEKADAERCISSIQAGELTLDGKVLSASSAMKRDKLQQEIEKKAETKKQPKDNRNLYLAREGFIRGGTSVAADISEHDLKLRAKLESNKKKSLKNLHNFVSPTRLCIHNLPPSCDDKKLRKIFAAAVDRTAKITEARVMLNMKRLGADGKGVSKGFGFVNFAKHEDALKALRHVNNNPEIFTDQMRPVVSFSIENKAALMVKERRLQRSRDKLKELNQLKNSSTKPTNQRDIDYDQGERSAFEGLRAKTDVKTLPRRVGEKVRADKSRRDHLMRLKRLAKKAKKQPEFRKKKEKKPRAPTKAQLKEKRQDKSLNDMINRRRKNMKKNFE